MAKNTLEIIIKANTAQAQQALKSLQTTVGAPFQKLQGTVGQLGSAFQAVTGISLTTAGAFAAVGMAASKASDFIKQSVAETVAYAQSVRELSYVLGTSAEETSRIIQVADDYLISVEKVTTALRFAVKNGFEPSIESLANLADQFNAISDPNERAAKMVQIFGRNWSALVPMLKAGGDAIRENAAAISEGLVLDDADIQSVFEYQQALDQLGDAVQDLKYRIGMELVPALADVLTAFNTNASMADQMSRSFTAFNGVMEQSNRSALALENAFQLGFNVSPQGLVAIAEQLQAIEDPMKRVAEAQRIFGDNWVEVYGIIELSSGVLNALSGSLGKIAPDANEATRGVKVMADALDDAADAAEKFAAKEKLAGDALKGYAKNVTKLGMTTQQENDLIAQFATSLGDIDTTALIAANDMDLLDAAMAANAITLQQYTAISLTAAQGTGELSDVTRAYLEAQLAMASGQTGVTNALEGTANAATQVRDQLVQVIGLAEQLRFAGPREVRNQIFDQLVSLLQNVDPTKAAGVATGIEDIGLAFGKFNANDLAIAEALPQFVQQLFTGISTGGIDPTKASEAVQAFLDAVLKLRTTGADLDATAILAPFKLEEAGITVESMIPATLLADEIARLALLSPTAGTGMGQVAASTGIFASNANGANQELTTLPASIETLGKKAAGAYSPLNDLATVIREIRDAAGTAAISVKNLVTALAGLQSKTITVTVNFAVGQFPSIPGSGSSVVPAGYQRNQPRARGGPVKPWEDYLVGEEGPELFIPQTAGEIIPADVTQAAILSAMQGFAPGREGTPETRNQERSKARRKRRADEAGMAGEAAPFVPGLPTQPVPAYDPRFMGQNLDAYMEFFQAANSLAPGIRAAAAGGEGGPTDRATPNRRRRKKSWREGGGWTTEVENVINSTYQEFTGGSQSMKLPQAIGEIETNQGVNAGDAEVVRNPNGQVNNYFPISRVSDELDARQLARLVAAEMARMPSR